MTGDEVNPKAWCRCEGCPSDNVAYLDIHSWTKMCTAEARGSRAEFLALRSPSADCHPCVGDRRPAKGPSPMDPLEVDPSEQGQGKGKGKGKGKGEGKGKPHDDGKGKGDDNGKGRGKFQGDVNPRRRARDAIRASAIGENHPQASVDHRSNGHDVGNGHGSGHAPTCPTCRQPWPRKLDSPLQAPSELTWHRVPGWGHLFGNLMKFLVKSVQGWPEILHYLRQLVKFFNYGPWREELVRAVSPVCPKAVAPVLLLQDATTSWGLLSRCAVWGCSSIAFLLGCMCFWRFCQPSVLFSC